MHTGQHNWWKRAGMGLVLFATVFFSSATPAYAQNLLAPVEQALGAATGACPQGGAPVGIPCPPAGALESVKILDNEILKPAQIVGLMTVGTNLVTYVANRLAFELATTIATGGKGQAPLVNSKSLSDSWGEFGLDVVGETLGSLDELNLDDSFGVNFSLCAPPNPILRANVAIGIKQAYQPRKPKCDFATVAKNWEASWSSIAAIGSDPTGEAMKLLAGSLRPGSNELSFAIQTSITTQDKVMNDRIAKALDFSSSEGFKPVTDAITGQVKTPAALVKEATTYTYKETDKNGVESTKEIIQNPEWGKLGVGVGLSVLNTFVNTLLAGGVNSLSGLLKEGLLPSSPPSDPFLPELASPQDVKERLAAKFGGVKTANPFSVTNYDAMSEFTVCPPGGLANRGINNCVMDASFLSAVSRARSGEPLTVRAAVKEGLLHGDWPLISSADTSRNQDPLCYTYGYCYGNLAKLRKARIIPIGWEMAAALSTTQQPITLQRAMDAFDKCDTASDLCRLVDPDWILMYPESQCRAQANGEILSVKNSASRASSCVDVQSCVSRRADGSCEAYGYCVSEKNVWRFEGQSCPTQFASCMTFSNKADGKSSSFLLNTVNYANCSESNAGCRWYAIAKAVVTQGVTSTLAWAGGTDTDTEKRVYLNGKAKQCSSAEAGCTQLYPAAGLRLNMIVNPDLETDANTDNIPDAWRWDGAVGQYIRDSNQGYSGSEGSVRPAAASDLVQEGIALTPGAFHTFSVYLKGTVTGDAVQVRLTNANGTAANITGTNFSSTTCSRAGSTYLIQVTNDTTDYRRFTCTFAAPAEPTFASIRLVNEALTYDAVQLEVGEVASSFIQDGYSATSPVATYLRMAPAYLGCTGAPTDRPECATYAQACSAQDVGCSLYRPADGGPSVPATATDMDRCPTACVGYAAYKQEASLYEEAKFPVAFIPTAARACDVRYAGCDSFTNLDTVANGGEAVEYYTNLRACSKPEETDQDRTYFTWEGSDAAGYQLRTWQLLKESNGAAPCTSWAMTNAGTDAAPRPAISCTSTATVADTSCDEHADILRNPDCREFYDEAGVISYRLFSKTVTIAAECAPYRKTVALETDCRATGGLWTTAGECRYLGISKESNSCPSNVNGCRAYTGGAGNNVRTTFEETFEPPAFLSASVTDVRNATSTLTSESVATGGHSLSVVSTGANDGFKMSLTGRVTFGKTYALDFWAKGNGSVQASFVQQDGTVRVIGLPVTVTGDWKSFSVGPVDSAAWTGFDDRATLQFTATSAGSFYVDNIRLKESQDTIGIIKGSWTIPAACDRGPGLDGTPGTGAAAPQYYLGCKAYTETKSNQTSAFYQFTRLCSENTVGCQAFFDTRNSKAPAGHIYNAVCKGANVATSGTACIVGGMTYCTIPTGQTSCTFEYPGAALPQAAAGAFSLSFGPDTRVIRNDAAVYLVDNGQASCAEVSMGCQEVGKPVFNQDRSRVTSYETAYVFDRPDEYKDTLCSNGALFCAAWNTLANGTFFFKDPGEQTCDYRTDVRRSDGRLYTGWFRKGTNEACAANNVKAGDQYGIWRNGDDGANQYDNWVGSCTNQYDLCTEYVDTTDTTATTNKGKEYTYLAKGALSSTAADECNGQVSQRAGCVLLNNTNVLDLPYAAGPSYVASTHADVLYGGKENDLRSPVSCLTPTSGIVQKPDGTSVNLCTQRCAYQVGVNRNLRTGLRVEGAAGVEYVGSCLVDMDCPTMETDIGRRLTGSCVTVAAAYAAKNDSNLVKSVVRDRECAEWLACQSSYSAWDDQNNKYVPICEQVRLYRDFKNGQHIDPVQDISLEPISADLYKARNLSWYGTDYSGYSIPGMVPVPAIKHINVNPNKWCQNTTTGVVETVSGTGAAKACTVVGDCSAGFTCENAGTDFRTVVVAGTCVESTAKRGGECRVGSCSISGARCNQNTDCGTTGGSCLIGFCQEVSGRTCTTDANCLLEATAKTCDTARGRCVDTRTPTANCASNDQCGARQTCYDYPGSRTGACFNNLCLTDFMDDNNDGRAEKFEAASAEPLSCRGYPEISSPLPSQVVSSWIGFDGAGARKTGEISTIATAARPYAFKNGFDQVPVCEPVCKDGTCKPSDECINSCSYEKVIYGEGATAKYYKKDIPDGGVCVGGTNAGKSCTTSDLCTGGSCQFATRQESKIGWQGYCLEYDTSIQLFGSQDPKDRPCLTWYPTDRAIGSTDLFGKDLQAGYYSGKDDYYCAASEVYVDLGTNITPGTYDVSCLKTYAAGQAGCSNNTPTDAMLDNVACPIGYYAITTSCGKAAPYKNVTNNIDATADSKERLCATQEGDDTKAAHPIICVPKYASRVSETDGKLVACAAPGERVGNTASPITSASKRTVTGDTVAANERTDVYIVSGADFNVARKYYEGCWVRGLTQADTYKYIHEDERGSMTIGTVAADGSWTRDGVTYENNIIFRQAYLGCKELVQTSSLQLSGQTDVPVLKNAAGLRVYNIARTDRNWTDGVSGFGVPGLNFRVNDTRATFAQAPGLDAISKIDGMPIKALTYVPASAGSMEAATYDPAVLGQPASCTVRPQEWSMPGCYNTPVGLDGEFHLCVETGASITSDVTPISSSGSSNGETLSWENCAIFLGGNVVRPEEQGGKYCTILATRNDGTLIDIVGVDCNQLTTDKVCIKDVNGIMPTICSETFGALDTDSGNAAGVDMLAVAAKKTSTQSPLTAIQSIFLKAVGIVEWKTGISSLAADWRLDFERILSGTANNRHLGQYEEKTPLPAGSNALSGLAAGDSQNLPKPPKVASIGTCDSNGCKESREGRINVNGIDAGIVQGSDGQKTANVSFYAWADSEQMPLRRIIVDWGDATSDRNDAGRTSWLTTNQTGSASDDNFYKNRRGLNADGKKICGNPDNKTFGFSSQACEDGYANFTHDYVCSQTMQTNLPNCSIDQTTGQLRNSPCKGGVPDAGDKCVFQPRVQLVDNWGWCTGVCTSTEGGDGTNQCFGTECAATHPNSSSGASLEKNSNPWVYFSGYVVVEPSK